MPQITSNIEKPETVTQARRLALDAGVSLREWSGKKLTKIIQTETKKPKGKK